MPQNNAAKPYKLVASEARWISFEGNTYPVKNGTVYLMEIEAKPFLRSGAILPVDEPEPVQAGLDLKVK